MVFLNRMLLSAISDLYYSIMVVIKPGHNDFVSFLVELMTII